MVDLEVGGSGGRDNFQKYIMNIGKEISDLALSTSHDSVCFLVCSLVCLHAKVQKEETETSNLSFIPRFLYMCVCSRGCPL